MALNRNSTTYEHKQQRTINRAHGKQTKEHLANSLELMNCDNLPYEDIKTTTD